jgi:hypothetical protein
MRKRRIRRRDPEPKTRDIPRLALSHGQTIWLLSELGFRGDVSISTFNYYVKSLRKLGVPFEHIGPNKLSRKQATYVFEDLMELVVALLLRVYGTLPDAVAAGLRDYRDDLRPIYRRAYFELVEPTSRYATIVQRGRVRSSIGGLYLDLNIRYCAGKMIGFGPPKALGPAEAIQIYARAEAPARAYLPLNISRLAQLIISQSKSLPNIPRGRAAQRLRLDNFAHR